jgi:hypothetical protein
MRHGESFFYEEIKMKKFYAKVVKGRRRWNGKTVR